MLDIADNRVFSGDTLYICGSPTNSKHRRLLETTVLEISDKKATVIIHESGRVREVTKAISLLPVKETNECPKCILGELHTFVWLDKVQGKYGTSTLYKLTYECEYCDHSKHLDKHNHLNLKLKEHAGLL